MNQPDKASYPTKKPNYSPIQEDSKPYEEKGIEDMGVIGLEEYNVPIDKANCLRGFTNPSGAKFGALLSFLSEKTGFSKIHLLLTLIESLTPSERNELITALTNRSGV
jgi:hypothetical protein